MRKKDWLKIELYYDKWREGLDQEEIRQYLEMDEKSFRQLTPHFLAYVREKQFNTPVRTPEVSIPLTPERRQKFLQFMSIGKNHAQAAELINVPLPTVYEVWFKEDPEFKNECLVASKRALADIEISLYTKAKGYDTKIKTTTKTTGCDKEGRPTESATESITEKHVPADTNAIKFFLTNNMPDKYSLDGEQNKAQNKGAILEALDELIGSEQDDNLDKIYKEDNPAEKEAQR